MWNIIAKKQSQKNICCLVLRQFPEPLVGNLVFFGGQARQMHDEDTARLFGRPIPKANLEFLSHGVLLWAKLIEFSPAQKIALQHVAGVREFCKSLPLDRAGGGVSFGWECWPNYVPMASSAQRFQTMSLNLQPFHFQGVARYILATKCHAGRLLPTKKTPGVRPAAVPPL